METGARGVAARRSVLLGGLGALAGCSTAGPGATPSPSLSSSPAAPSTSASTSAAPTAEATATPEPSPSATPTPTAASPGAPGWAVDPVPGRSSIVTRFGGRVPTEWGLAVTGVTSRLETATGVALTFDACGGTGGGTGYDAALIDLLRRLAVPATLFLNRRWIDANPGLARELAADPLFELESHGVRHLPLSVTGRSAYGIAGTASVAEAYDEVVAANDWFTDAVGRTPWFFRSGTAHYDEVAVAVSRAVGQAVAGFSVNGDAGATYTPGQVAQEVGRVRAGDIVISHMNRPGRGTSEGYAAALPRLVDRGVRFVRLREGFA